jgi:heme a synthase
MSLAYRLAVVTAIATVLLILAGGLVTNTGSGLAVPDWPTTFGYNMFLYPWSRMVGGVLYEHSHRLLGALVGLLTLGLAVALWPAGPLLRSLGLIAVGAVVAQGILGGLRVVLVEHQLALVHGSFAHAFLALLVSIALLLSRRPADEGASRSPGLRTITLLAAVLVYLQIVFGALLTHLTRPELHLLGALVVYVLLPMVTARARRAGDRTTRIASYLLLGLLGVQLVLGVGSYLTRFAGVTLPGGPATALALPVLHRLTASLILAAVVTLAVRIGLAERLRHWHPSVRLSPGRASS